MKWVMKKLGPGTLRVKASSYDEGYGFRIHYDSGLEEEPWLAISNDNDPRSVQRIWISINKNEKRSKHRKLLTSVFHTPELWPALFLALLNDPEMSPYMRRLL